MLKVKSQIILTNHDSSFVRGLIGISGNSKNRRTCMRKFKRHGHLVPAYAKSQSDQVEEQMPFGPFTTIEG